MQATQAGCRFCEIVAGAEKYQHEAPGIVSFPAVPASIQGHLLIVPVAHVADAREDPALAGRVFEAAARAASRAGGPCNLVTNAGAIAGQKIGHFHVHLLPRTSGGPLEIPPGEVLRISAPRNHAWFMWRPKWRRRNSPGFRTCSHGRTAWWDYLDGGWWHSGDLSECADPQDAPPLPPRLERRYAPLLRH